MNVVRQARCPAVLPHSVGPFRVRVCNPPPRSSVRAWAKRRVLDREYPFPEVYSGVIEKLRERNHLSIRDMSQLIECIKSVEQAGRCLDILAAYLASKSDAFAQAQSSMDEMDEGAPSSSSSSSSQDNARWLADWPHRKRFLSRIAEIAVMELNRPDLVYAIVSNTERFKLSTYFGKELILQLGQFGSVPLDVLTQVARLTQQQRGPTDKGTRGAFQALLQITQDRGSNAEVVASIKQQLNELKAPAALHHNSSAPVIPQAAMAATPTAVLV